MTLAFCIFYELKRKFKENRFGQKMTETFEYLNFGSIEEFRFRTEYTARQTKGGRHDYKMSANVSASLFIG